MSVCILHDLDLAETARRKRLSSGSELPPKASRLRKKSLSSAQLPILMDDPRWVMHMEQSKYSTAHIPYFNVPWSSQTEMLLVTQCLKIERKNNSFVKF